MPRILIVDDDTMLCEALTTAVDQMGYEADAANTLRDALRLARTTDYDAVILDVRMPDGSGLENLPKFQECPSAPEVIILTGVSDPDGAELAIRSGAWSYIAKPPTLSAIQLPLRRAVEHHRSLRRLLPLELKRSGIIGESRAMRGSLGLVAQAGGTEASVLITGDTGTGKELFARAIHDNSRRAEGPFVVVDCAALPDKLVESELFGFERGAFTGADRRSDGLIRQAHGGTLFLDEIGELPPGVQKAFLRVLQGSSFRPVGGVKEVHSDFRLVVATNRDLEAMAADGRFREDLLYRIRTITIALPRLKDRCGDVELLCRHFVAKQCHALGIPAKRVSPDYLEALEQYDWPGNVRELIHAVERSLASALDEPVLIPMHLPTNIRVSLARSAVPKAPAMEEGLGGPSKTGPFPSMREFRGRALATLETRYLQDLMDATGHDVPRACALSGLSRARLYALLKKYGGST